MTNRYTKVMEILTSELHDLRSLAQLASPEIFTFYQGSDLRDVDAANEDLRGLNFHGADLRGANLENVKFEEGAFNNSILDEKYDEFRDDFDFFMDDVEDKNFEYMSLHYRIRPGLVDYVLKEVGVIYKDFARSAKISTATLRRVRDGHAVSDESIFGILDALRSIKKKVYPLGRPNEVFSAINQPVLNVGYYNKYGIWTSVKRSEIPNLIAMLKFVNSSRYGLDWKSRPARNYWRSKPSTLQWAYRYYIENPHSLWQLSQIELERAQHRATVLLDDNEQLRLIE